MPKLDLSTVPTSEGTTYPEPFARDCRARLTTRLALAAGLTQFGVNITRLPPGAWSSQRHWHAHEDEFAYVLEGEVSLIEDGGEVLLRPGDCAGFKAGVKNGHHFVNRGAADAAFLVIGSRLDEDYAEYPDIDMKTLPGRYSGRGGYAHKDGTPY